ncbi:hypothetical protein JYT87_02260 [Nitrospira defluvii]|nr:hypothetical protein [Nitrospira defluvii]
MTILHILKNKADRYPLDLIEKQSPSNKISILLIQEARGMEIKDIGASIFVLSNDLKKNHKSEASQVSNQEMLQMIFEAESVMVW